MRTGTHFMPVWAYAVVALLGVVSVSLSMRHWGYGESQILRLIDNVSIYELRYFVVIANALLACVFYWVGFYLLFVTVNSLFGSKAAVGFWVVIGQIFELGQILFVFALWVMKSGNRLPNSGFFVNLFLLVLAIVAAFVFANKAYSYLE